MSSESKATLTPFLAKVPVPIARCARALGIDVKRASLPPKISGQILKSEESNSGYLIRVNRHEAEVRQRFTIAHELAHFLLHKHLIGDGISDSILYRSTLSDQIEAEANRLGAALIMPIQTLRKNVADLGGASDEVAILLAGKYNVSKLAMRIRLGLE